MNQFADLAAAIEAMPVSDERVPSEIDSFWVHIVRGCILSWAKEMKRDVGRAQRGLEEARRGEDRVRDEIRGVDPVAEQSQDEPTDDQIAGLEEAFWRLRAATEKADALISIAYGPKGLHPYDSRRKGLRFRPDYDENSKLLKERGTETSLAVRDARSRLEAERATLRRHQLMHGAVPIAKLHDLTAYIVVHHRDGRIISGGYELSRLAPERWSEGIDTAAPSDLFRRRLHEAERSIARLEQLVVALAKSLPIDARIEVPQHVYLEEDERTVSLERPTPIRPPRRLEVRFVPDDDPAATGHLVSSERETRVGEELALDDGVWRVIRVEAGSGDPEAQIAYCRRRPAAEGRAKPTP